ncbi:hypothetical protein CEP52_007580 [Fusarium oligoseptatum]|uniref:Uncharacterized protein n=1 Tax=Fusarium oligoseptatum TaxID=2604345 RepID=A0A428TM73_9HYPO|nr:hypothetical protein CEP52_007580 [Fusarium oligoseptatum]
MEAKAHAPEPTTTPRTVQAKRPTRLSDCVPHGPGLDSSSDNDAEEKCSDPGCRATHAGHHPVRHSIECAARRSLKGQITEDDELEVIDMDEEKELQRPKNSPLHSSLENKIDQLYHHAEDLHHSQHIMEHLAAGTRQLERSAVTRQRRADRKDALSRMADHGLDIPSRSPGDHQLSQDEITSVGEETVEHSLSTDIKAPEAAEEHTLAADPAIERDLSPRSHLLLDDVRTKVARLLKAHSISQDRVIEAKGRPVGRLRQSFPFAKTTSSTKPLLQPKPLPLNLGEQKNVIESSTPRLRVMEVEQSLARKSAEDLLEESRHKTQQEEVVATREMKSMKHCKTTSHSSYKETETVTEIHNPKPVIPYNHVCAWRTRYMDLSTEVDQLKSEASSRAVVDQATEQPRDQGGVDVGVGTSFSHKCPDIDIEGLTIVMHMRGKDDLVINTKLKDSARRG